MNDHSKNALTNYFMYYDIGIMNNGSGDTTQLLSKTRIGTMLRRYIIYACHVHDRVHVGCGINTRASDLPVEREINVKTV